MVHLDWERIKERLAALLPGGMVGAGVGTSIIHSVDVVASMVTHVIGMFFAILGLVLWIRRQVRRRRAKHRLDLNGNEYDS